MLTHRLQVWFWRCRYRPGRTLTRFIARDIRREVEIFDTSRIEEGIVIGRIRTWNLLYVAKGLKEKPVFGEIRELELAQLWRWNGEIWGGPVSESGDKGQMQLEQYYAGDQEFQEYSEKFIEFWETFEGKERLLELVGHDLIIARPLAYHLEESYEKWLHSTVPVLDNGTPLDCLQTPDGIKRLKTYLHRLPY